MSEILCDETMQFCGVASAGKKDPRAIIKRDVSQTYEKYEIYINRSVTTVFPYTVVCHVPSLSTERTCRRVVLS